MFAVTMSVLVCSFSISSMPTIVFPDPQGSTIVPNPVPGPPSPKKEAAASFWYSLNVKSFPDKVRSRSEKESPSPSRSGTSSFTGQPVFKSSSFIVPLSVSKSLKANRDGRPPVVFSEFSGFAAAQASDRGCRYFNSFLFASSSR